MPTIRQGQRLEERRETSDPAESSPKTQSYVPHPRRVGAKTSEPVQNTTPGRTALLVARYEGLGNEIREKLRTVLPRSSGGQNHPPNNHLPTLEGPRSTGTTPRRVGKMESP